MNSISTSIVIIPGVVALLLCLLFYYLYQQSQQVYFRAWQIAWACYSIHYALDAVRYYRPPALGRLLCQLIIFGSHGSEHLRLHAAHADRFPLSLVRRSVGFDGSDFRLPRFADASIIRPTTARPAPAEPDRYFLECGAAVLFGGFLFARSSPGICGFQNPGHFAGALGGADGRSAVRQPRHGDVWQRGPCLGTDSADAARHRHGDGAVRERTQRGAGKYSGAIDAGR